MKMNRVFQLYKDLLEKYGQPQWWPAESPFEVAAGAILTQNTNWKNVEKAITKLKGLNLMTAEAIAGADIKTLESLPSAGGITAHDVGEAIGKDRSTAHRSLEKLVAIGVCYKEKRS